MYISMLDMTVTPWTWYIWSCKYL